MRFKILLGATERGAFAAGVPRRAAYRVFESLGSGR
jgi:hypothetical protein